MERPEKEIMKNVKIVSSFFGVHFVFADDSKQSFKIFLITSLQFCFFCFTIYGYQKILGDMEFSNVFYNVKAFQVVTPLLIEVVCNLVSLRKRNQERKIIESFEKIGNFHSMKINTNEIKELHHASLKLKVKFSILIVVRIFKSYLHPNDFAFTFYVDWLTVLAKTLSRNIREGNMSENDIKQQYWELHELANNVTERFSLGLFLNVTFNFVLLVFDFYWIFVRIVFGPMR